MTAPTDTPRTDSEIEAMGLHSLVVPVSFSRQLERELAASKAEVARLQMEQDGTCNAEELRQEREARKRAEAEVERLGGLLYETRSLLTEFFDCVDIGGLHDGDCNISTEDPEKWDLGCNCTTAELRRKYIELYSK